MQSCNHSLAEPSGLPDKWPVSGRSTFCGALCSSLALHKPSSRLHLQGRRTAAAYELGFSGVISSLRAALRTFSKGVLLFRAQWW